MKTANNMAIAGVGGIADRGRLRRDLLPHVRHAVHDRRERRRHAGQPRARGDVLLARVAASVGNTIFAIVLFGCYMLFWPLICYISFLQPTRMLFAYAFDGILPKGVTARRRKSARRTSR